MGLTTGFISGLTLTSSILYLSLLSHQRHRSQQAHVLSQQSLLLNSIFDPSIIPAEEAPRFVVRRAKWSEAWKDRWNAEVEGAFRWCRGVRWDNVREGIEGRWRDWREGEKKS